MEIRRINNGKIFYFGNDVIPKYSFNAKELDEETGMYYFETRYYRAPTFISRDPLMNEKPWLTPYHYCSNNPVGRIDPTGMMDDEWEYDQKAKTLTWISNKGGNTIQYINTNGNKIPIPKSTNNFIETAEGLGISVRFPEDAKPTFISTLKNVASSINKMDNLSSVEMWLDSPSESIGEAIGKTAANIGYSMINSPYSFFRGKTLGGSSINSTEKMDAFVDMVGSIVGRGIKGIGTTVNSKGLNGFNEYVKKNPGILKGHSRSEVGKMYQSNKDLQNSARQADIFIQSTNTTKEVKKMTWGWFFGGFFRWIIRRICGRRTKLKDEIWGSIDGFFAKADGWILTENDILGVILIFIIIYIFSVIYL